MKVAIYSGPFHNLEPFRPEVHVAPGLVSSKAPYLVGLIETEHPEIIICAGSLLNYRWVLTLASCTEAKKHDKKRFKVVAPRLGDGSYFKFTIQIIVAHELYQSARQYLESDSWGNNSHDVSLIKMNGGLGFIDYVTQPSEWNEKFENKVAIVIELWNETRHVIREEEFVERSFNVLPRSECQKVFNGISVFEMCAKVVENALTCNIQKVIENPNMGPYHPFPKMIIGIARNKDFCKDKVLVFTRVSVYLKWIASRIVQYQLFNIDDGADYQDSPAYEELTKR